MTEIVLQSVIWCLCGHQKPKAEAVRCIETYANCAIGAYGRILTKEEFNKKCNFIKGQEACTDAN